MAQRTPLPLLADKMICAAMASIVPSYIYSVWFEDDSPGGYFSFSPELQSWEYYGYLNADEQTRIADFLQEHREIKWV